MFPSFFHEQRRKCTSSLELSFNTSLPLLTSSGDVSCTSHCKSNNRFTTCSHTCGYGSKWIQNISRYIQILYPRNWMVDPKHNNASVLVAWGLDFDICPPYRFHIFSRAKRSEQPDPTSTALTAFPGTCNMLGCWVCQNEAYVMFFICLFSVHLGFRNTQTMLGSATAKQHAQHARLDMICDQKTQQNKGTRQR